MYTRRRTTKQKHNAVCAGHHVTQTNINHVNKIWALIRTTRGKDEPNIVFMGKSQHETHNVKTHNGTILQDYYFFVKLVLQCQSEHFRWCRLSQKRVVSTKFYIYVFITITRSISLLVGHDSLRVSSDISVPICNINKTTILLPLV